MRSFAVKNKKNRNSARFIGLAQKKKLTLPSNLCIELRSAGVVKLVDAEDSKSSGLTSMRVRVSPPAPQQYLAKVNQMVNLFLFPVRSISDSLISIF